MVSKLSAATATTIVALLVACNVPSGPPPITNVRVVNNLTNTTVTASGKSIALDAVDLYGVFAGSVAFQYVAGGATSFTKTDSDTGIVKISVDSGVGYFGGNEVCVFTNITTPSSTRITTGTLNNVEFNPSSLANATIRLVGSFSKKREP